MSNSSPLKYCFHGQHSRPRDSFRTLPGKTKRQGGGKLPQWPITGKVQPDPRTGEMDCPAPLTMVQAAKCLESGQAHEACQRQLQGACKGLGIGKYCGMKHEH